MRHSNQIARVSKNPIENIALTRDMSAVKALRHKSVGKCSVSFILAGRNINGGKIGNHMSLKWVSGPTVTYDLMMFSVAGKWLAQSPLHA